MKTNYFMFMIHLTVFIRYSPFSSYLLHPHAINFLPSLSFPLLLFLRCIIKEALQSGFLSSPKGILI